MNYRVILLALSTLVALGVQGRTYRLEGAVGGKYPIVIELEEDRGLFFGRYAYESTLQKQGNLDCSWLAINPSYERPATEWTIRDCKPEIVETWRDVRFSDGNTLTARMTNNQGRTYDIRAHVTESSKTAPSTIAYFKEHLGEAVSDFSMFSDPSIIERFEEMMGEQNFSYMTHIYQTEGSIEYNKGMFWASAFKAHECCDPATAWAYDSFEDAFYVWIRRDGRDYWWSETGTVPIKFQQTIPY